MPLASASVNLESSSLWGRFDFVALEPLVDLTIRLSLYPKREFFMTYPRDSAVLYDNRRNIHI
jgi:hypothetical protein